MPDDKLTQRDWELEASLLEEGRQAIRAGDFIRGDAAYAWLRGLANDPSLETPAEGDSPSRKG